MLSVGIPQYFELLLVTFILAVDYLLLFYIKVVMLNYITKLYNVHYDILELYKNLVKYLHSAACTQFYRNLITLKRGQNYTIIIVVNSQ